MTYSKESLLIPESNERLYPGHKLLLAGPASILGFTIAQSRKKGLTTEINTDILKEYLSIYELLSNLLGSENLVVSKNDVVVGHSLPYGGIEFKSIPLPNDINLGGKSILFFQGKASFWPRDAFSLLGDSVFVDSNYWQTDYIQRFEFITSPLGEGGKVLHKTNAMLVTPDIWKEKKELNELREKGFKIGCIPFVDPVKQKFKFIENHIDGHASLLEDKNGELALVVADSYSRQGKKTLKKLRNAAEIIEATLHEVDDQALPPLALNLIQFNDRSVVVTKADRKDLEFTLSFIVGPDKIFTTPIPIQLIPELANGGIRCLTNVLLPGMVSTIES